MRNRCFVIALLVFLMVCFTACSSTVSQTTSNAQKTENPKNSSESPALNPTDDRVTDVSIIQLISNPEKFDGRYVRIIGFVRLEFEGDAIYLHHDDYKYGIYSNGLWLNITKGCCGKDLKSADRKYVLVEGTFDIKNKGHMGLWSGSIKNIKRFQVWSDMNGKRE
jgi:hypothetical protein